MVFVTERLIFTQIIKEQQQLMDYNELLNIANNEGQGGDDNAMYERPQPPQEQYIMQNEERPPYDPQEEMRRIQERQEKGEIAIDLSRTKIPQSIINEFIQHPINYTVEDPRMKEFTEHLGGKMNNAADLMKRVNNISVRKGVVEHKDTPQSQSLNEVEEMFAPISTTPQPRSGSIGGIDYALIKNIVEHAIDERLEKLTKAILTESAKIGGGAKLSAIKLTDKFMLLDENGNVYSCEPKFVGKNKAKPKK